MGNQSLYSYHAKFCLRYMYWLEIFSGNPLFIAARCRFTFTYSTCQWAASVDLLPCCKKSYSCGEAHFRSGLFVTQYRICVHTLDCHLRAAKKQQARRSSARGKLESEKVGLPWAWPAVLEGTYDPCFNQIHARNIIKHSNNVSFHYVLFNIVNNKSTFVNHISHFYGRITGDFG